MDILVDERITASSWIRHNFRSKAEKPEKQQARDNNGNERAMDHTTTTALTSTLATSTTDNNTSTSLNYEHSPSSSSSNASTASTSSYEDLSTNDLSILSAAMLITADVLGTGILALPHDVKVLGKGIGIFFIVINLPINLYAGTILCRAADYVEERMDDDEGEIWAAGDSDDDDEDEARRHGNDLFLEDESKESVSMYDYDDEEVHDENHPMSQTLDNNESSENSTRRKKKKKRKQQRRQRNAYESVTTTTSSAADSINSSSSGGYNSYTSDNKNNDDSVDELHMNPSHNPPSNHHNHHHHPHHNSATYDFIGMTSTLFPPPPATPIRLVLMIYYLNLFLVLGNYILVMSHSVQAVLVDTSLENLCLPLAGLMASTLMLGVSQLRTMAKLGRSASVISLLSLAVVVVLCLVSIHTDNKDDNENNTDENDTPNFSYTPQRLLQDSNEEEKKQENESSFQSVLRQLSALSSICFAIGSQKLLLNIRHEMKVRTEAAPQGLGLSLLIFGLGYIGICLAAGDDPPSFLFDAISPETSPTQHRIGGLFLWIHVSVSYAINSQALCSSLDRLYLHQITKCNLHQHHSIRWFLLTLLTSVSSYIVANAIPFFADLVSLIGALTSVPLTLMLPAIFYRRVCHIVPVWKFVNMESFASYLLFVVSLIFLILGLFGSVGSISLDWEENKSDPFSCH